MSAVPWESKRILNGSRVTRIILEMSKLISLRSMGPTGREFDDTSLSPSRARSLLGYEEILEFFLPGVMCFWLSRLCSIIKSQYRSPKHHLETILNQVLFDFLLSLSVYHYILCSSAFVWTGPCFITSSRQKASAGSETGSRFDQGLCYIVVTLTSSYT